MGFNTFKSSKENSSCLLLPFEKEFQSCKVYKRGPFSTLELKMGPQMQLPQIKIGMNHDLFVLIAIETKKYGTDSEDGMFVNIFSK
jgi:hypothetical protein